MAGLHLEGPSRDSLAALRARFRSAVAAAPPAELDRVASDLEAVTALLGREPTLRRHLVDWSVPAEARQRLVRDLLTGQVSEQVLELSEVACGSRWSRAQDLSTAVELLSRLAVFAVAERDGILDEVEDHLFRFSRIIATEHQLRGLLTDIAAPARRRVELLDAVLGDKVDPVTLRLLEQTVGDPRGRNLEDAVAELSQLAAARRDHYLARVRAAQPLTQAQEQHLVRTLGQLYGRDITLQVEVDPSILGGLIVQVGEEIIDGSLSGRLAAARSRLVS